MSPAAAKTPKPQPPVRIRMHTSLSGPNRVWKPGGEYMCEAAEAKRLCDSGQAELVEDASSNGAGDDKELAAANDRIAELEQANAKLEKAAKATAPAGKTATDPKAADPKK